MLTNEAQAQQPGVTSAGNKDNVAKSGPAEKQQIQTQQMQQKQMQQRKMQQKKMQQMAMQLRKMKGMMRKFQLKDKANSIVDKLEAMPESKAKKTIKKLDIKVQVIKTAIKMIKMQQMKQKKRKQQMAGGQAKSAQAEKNAQQLGAKMQEIMNMGQPESEWKIPKKEQKKKQVKEKAKKLAKQIMMAGKKGKKKLKQMRMQQKVYEAALTKFVSKIKKKQKAQKERQKEKMLRDCIRKRQQQDSRGQNQEKMDNGEESARTLKKLIGDYIKKQQEGELQNEEEQISPQTGPRDIRAETTRVDRSYTSPTKNYTSVDDHF